MTEEPGFDTAQAHRYFSARCFNLAWDLIDKADRTPEEDAQMVHLAHASLWHWSRRPDCSDKSLSIGYWQASRIYALLGEAENARKYARLCLEKTPPDEPFYLGYANEALARAEGIAGNGRGADEYLAEARRQAKRIADEEDRQLLFRDLETLR